MFNGACYNPRAADLRTGRAVAAASPLGAERGRKVRTPKGSEPANGGAPAGRRLREQLLGRPCDDKCNREQTSQRALRFGAGQRVMGETVRPLGA